MATARDRHYHTRSVRLVTPLGVAAALPQPCHNVTPTRCLWVACLLVGAPQMFAKRYSEQKKAGKMKPTKTKRESGPIDE